MLDTYILLPAYSTLIGVYCMFAEILLHKCIGNILTNVFEQFRDCAWVFLLILWYKNRQLTNIEYLEHVFLLLSKSLMAHSCTKTLAIWKSDNVFVQSRESAWVCGLFWKSKTKNYPTVLLKMYILSPDYSKRYCILLELYHIQLHKYIGNIFTYIAREFLCWFLLENRQLPNINCLMHDSFVVIKFSAEEHKFLRNTIAQIHWQC